MAFEGSLQLAANQSRSYFGAALAAKQVNDSDKAKTYLANSLTFAVLALRQTQRS